MSNELGPHTNHRIIFGTVGGEFAAIVTIKDLGADASPVIVGELEQAIRGELGHLIVESKTYRQ